MKTRSAPLAPSCSLTLLSLLLGGVVGCVAETDGGGASTGGSRGTTTTTSTAEPTACGSVTVLSTDAGNGPIVIQGDSLLWAISAATYPPPDSATFRQIPFDGTAEATLVVPLANPLVGPMATDAGHVYWAGMDGVMRTDASGGSLTQLASPTLPPPSIGEIAVDADSVYWVSFGVGEGPSESTAFLMKTSLGDGGTSMFASFSWSSGSSNVFAIDDASVYWFDYFEGTILKAPKAGGPPVTLVTGQVAAALVVDAESVYWLGMPGHADPSEVPSVMKVSKMGGAPVTLATGTLLNGIAVDATGVYWSDWHQDDTFSIRHTSPDGGPVETLHHDGIVPIELTACPGGVCWVTLPVSASASDSPMSAAMRWQWCH